MKRVFFAVALSLFVLSSCIGASNGSNSAVEDSSAASVAKKDVVEVLSFHGAQRCITCRAIESLTREVVEEFADELASGRLKMVIYDITTPGGEAVADSYEVASSSLYINKWQGGKESRNNMTRLGFTKAKNSPEEFKEQIRAKILELL